MMFLMIDGSTNDSKARGSPKKLIAQRSFESCGGPAVVIRASFEYGFSLLV